MKAQHKHIIFIISFLGCLFSSFVNAETMESKKIAAAIPRSLLKKGLNKIGPIDLDELATAIETEVKFAVIPVFSIGAGTNGTLRSGSSCRMSEKSVFVNEPHLQNLKHIRLIKSLLLHESLCALGWDDDNYTISATMTAIDRILDSPDADDREAGLHFIENADFKTAFQVRLNHHNQDQRFFRPDKIVVAGGGVTGVGGGGDGFALYLKAELLRRFFAINALCAKEPKLNTMPFPGADPKELGFEMNLNCFETRLYTWWSYILSLNVETAYFEAAKTIEFPNELPWAQSFVIDSLEVNPHAPDSARIQITLDSLRWMIFDQAQWTEQAMGIFMTLIAHYYPSPNSLITKEHPIIEIKGKKDFVESYFNSFKYAPAQRCQLPRENKKFEMHMSYSSTPLAEFIRKRIELGEEALKQPPYCVYTID